MAGKNITYVMVSFWLDKADHDALRPPHLVIDFKLPLRPGQHAVRRGDGHFKLTDGTYIPPLGTSAKAVEDFQYVEGFSLDGQIEDTIDAYWKRARANGFSGDHTGDSTKPFYRNGALVKQAPTSVIVRDNSDPDRVLEFTEVTGLRDTKKEVPDAVGLGQ